MANDRIYLVCKFCEEMQMFWKFYPMDVKDAGYLADADKLAAFVELHLRNCHPMSKTNHLAGEPGFILITENPNAKTTLLDEVSEKLYGNKASENDADKS